MGSTSSFDFSALHLLPPRSLLTGSALDGYDAQLARIQRFRGGVYVADQAIPASALDADGRHRSTADTDRWHLYMCEQDANLMGSAWAIRHEQTIPFSGLHMAEYARRMPNDSADDLHTYVEAIRRKSGTKIGEIGGWVVASNRQLSSTGLMFVPACWGLFQMLGGAIVLSAATVRHNSAAILKRVGGFNPIVRGSPLAPYFDTFHHCDMEIVAFDSRLPPKLFPDLADRAEERLRELCGDLPGPESCRASQQSTLGVT